jgi:hypothetical protein
MASDPLEASSDDSLYSWLMGGGDTTSSTDRPPRAAVTPESASADLLDQALARLDAAQSYEDVLSIRSLYQPHLAGQDYNKLDRYAEGRIVAIKFQPMVDLINRTHYPRDEDVRRVPVVSRKIDAIRDILPIGQLVYDGRIYGVPGDRSLPIYMTPHVPGAESFTNLSRYFHEYWAGQVPIAPWQAQDVMPYAIATPTGGPDNHPATTGGTENDVGRTGIPWMRRNGTDLEFGPEKNWVRSFLVPSYDPERYPDVVVNQTEAGQHSAEPGVVALGTTYDQNGNPILTSYGMGTTPWMQTSPFFWHGLVDDYWSKHNREILAPLLGQEEPSHDRAESLPWSWW